ncbi:hypothetical protein ABZ801_41470 [Actinomadura sp. NPDC047616]|uniref:hypothetical protein n=1 Tax=Actinomadura sp. NPDC047616 TaxID=3155914 RepID=UPI0033E12209
MADITDDLSDVISGLTSGLAAVYAELDAAGYGWLVWALIFTVSIVLGIRHVRWHMRRTQISIGGQVIASRTGVDHSGATVFRSADSVARRASLSPFHGRPAFWRGVPYPAAAALLWLWAEHRLVFAAVTAGGAAYAGRRVHQVGADWQHRRRIVAPMTKALGPALGERPDRILQGIVIPRDYATRDDVELVIPLPDDHRPQHITEASRIVHERLLGEWRHTRNAGAPYVLTFTRKPAPPSLVRFEDVAEIMLTGGSVWEPFIGLGTEAERISLNFDGHVVHLGISAGTGAGKSTLMRILAAQFAIRSGGTAKQTYLDVKGDDEGMKSVPGMTVINDIGDIHQLDGVFRMWAAIRWHLEELDARRTGKRGPKESWEPLILFNDEQNAFARFSQRAWSLVREKDDPKIPPVWEDLYLLAVMGRSFKIRLINAYQVMSADASGGGDAKRGGEVRRQFGYKMLARFDPSMWDNLVGTRPRGQSSDIPGRWLCVDNSGRARAVQLPFFEPHHVAELCAAAGLDTPAPTIGTASPDAVPAPAGATSHEIPASFGDIRDGDTSAPDGQREAVVLPFRQRGESPWQMAERAAAELPPAPQEPETRYTLKEACEAGIITIDFDTAKKQRTRARQRGEWYPPAEKRGNAETYTATDLRKFYGEGEQQQQERAR